MRTYGGMAATLCLLTALQATAHLCDDVFRQARDNLAVKVDVRDGQLRIGREGSFRVYMLNTMDRDIFEIVLNVRSDAFEARVTPSPDWRDYPRLRTSARGGPGQERSAAGPGGGKREYVTVHLTRKPNVPDGAYQVELELYSERRDQTFLTVRLDEAADLHPLPRAGNIVIDGEAVREEWAAAEPCTDFTVYSRAGRYDEKTPARFQTRARVLADEHFVYLMCALETSAEIERDRLTIHASPDPDTPPTTLTFDFTARTVKGPDSGKVEAEWAMNESGTMLEAKLSRKLLGLPVGSGGFYLNFTRQATGPAFEEVSYWRGNPYSYQDSVIYAFFAPQD